MTVKELFKNKFDSKMEEINNLPDWNKKWYITTAEQNNTTIEEIALNQIVINVDDVRKYSLFEEIEELKNSKMIASNNTHKSGAMTIYHLTKKGIKKLLKEVEF